MSHKAEAFRKQLEKDGQRWLKESHTNDDIAAALGYWLFYPSLLWTIGDVCRASSVNWQVSLRRSLDGAHKLATRFLMSLCEAEGIESGSLWEGAELCREITKPEECGPLSQWPDCISRRMPSLEAESRRAIRASRSTIERLNAKRRLPRVEQPSHTLAEEEREAKLYHDREDERLPLLTPEYTSRPETFGLSSSVLSKAFAEGTLTHRKKVKKTFAYLYTELVALRDKKSEEREW